MQNNCLSHINHIAKYHSPELKTKAKEMLAKDFQVISEDLTPEGTMFFINRSVTG